MMRRKIIMWTLAGGLPLCAVSLLVAGFVLGWDTDPESAWAQTAGVSSAEVKASGPIQVQTTAPRQTETPAAGWPARQGIRDFLRWENMSPEERRVDRAIQAQDEATEWSRLLEFLRTNSHNRYLLILHVGPQVGSPLRNRLMQRWLTVEQLQRTNPALYDVHVQEFQQEDLVIGLAAEMRRARHRGDSEALNNLRSEVHESASKLVELNFAERDLRIQQAQRLLDEEKQRLDQDRSNKDRLVDQRAHQLLQQFDFPVNNRNAPSTRPAPAQ